MSHNPTRKTKPSLPPCREKVGLITEHRSKLTAYLALLTIYIVWGTTFGAIHIGLETIEPGLLACLRYLSVGLILVPWCLMRGEKRPSRSSLKRDMIIGCLLFLFGNAISIWALQYMTTGLAAMITATSPFWMSWLATAVPPREKIEAHAIKGLLIGFLGLLVLLSPQLLHPMKVSAAFWNSFMLMMLVSVSWSVGSIYARKVPAQSSLLMSIGIQNLPPAYFVSEAWMVGKTDSQILFQQL